MTSLFSDHFKIALSYINYSSTEKDRYLRAVCSIPDEEKSNILPYKTEKVKDLITATFIDGQDIINQFTNWDLRYQLPSQYNMKIDKMTMAASLEARVPFLDKELVSWASSIPTNLKLKNNIEKYILRLAVKNILPPEILKRKKQGFSTPVSHWLKRDLAEISGEILDKLSKRNDLINPNYIKNVKKNRFKWYFTTRVWNLIMFELWYETFFENTTLNPIKI